MRKHVKLSLGKTASALLLVLWIRPAAGLPEQDAKTAARSLEATLERLATYEVGQDENILWQLRDYVRGHKESAEGRAAAEDKLAAFLGTKATFAGKMAVCRELRLIGGDKSVPALEKMLLDKELTDPARYALEAIPGGEPDKALLRALAQTKGETRRGIVASLGRRKARSAVPELSRLLRNADADLAKAAAAALGEIGESEAADSLFKALPGAVPELKETMATALMRIAAGQTAAGDAASASRICDVLLKEQTSPPLRLAALRLKIMSSGDKAPGLILQALAEPDPLAHEAAIGAIKSAFSGETIGAVAAAFPRLPAGGQIQLLAVLSDYPKDRVLPTAIQALGSENKDVRIAALNALQKIGDATTITKLAEMAAGTTAAEQVAARNALWGLKGKDVDEAVLAGLSGARDDAVRAEFVRAVGERRLYAGKGLVAQFTSSSSAPLQTQAIRAIRAVGTPSDMAGMIDLLVAPGTETVRRDVENTIVGLAQKIANPIGRSAVVRSRLAAEKDPNAKAALLHVLGRIGDDSSLPDVRRALKDKTAEIVDAAARALFSWPNPTAKDDVYTMARTSRNETHKILALQAYIRMTGLEKYRAPAAAVMDLTRALELAARPEEKKLILGLLPDFSCPEALILATTLQSDHDVAAEAKLAQDRIKARLEQEAKRDIG